MVEIFLLVMLFLTPTVVLGAYVIYSFDSMRNANALRAKAEEQDRVIKAKDEEIRNLETRLHWIKSTQLA